MITTPDSLKVNASLVNQATGRAAGIDALHIRDWGLGQNLVAAQQFPWFLEPSLASHSGLWTVGGLGSFDIGAEEVINEWSNNPATGAGSDWVVTFPTKRFQADEDAFNVQAACSVWRNEDAGLGATSFTGDPDDYPIWDGWTVADGITSGHRPRQLSGAPEECPSLNFDTVFQDGNDGRAELRVAYDIFDREEGEATFELDGPIVSPAPPTAVVIDNLRYEANVIRIGQDADNLPSVLGSNFALAVDTSTLDSGDPFGWMRIRFLDEVGDPVDYATTGFIYLQRDFGNPGLNFGQANEHGYTRP